MKDWAKYFKDEPLVIDFGGFVESRVIEAAQMADVTIVPLSFQSTADLMPAVKTIAAIQPYCENIAILINNTDPMHVSDLQGVLAVRFPKMPVFVVNHFLDEVLLEGWWPCPVPPRLARPGGTNPRLGQGRVQVAAGGVVRAVAHRRPRIPDWVPARHGLSRTLAAFLRHNFHRSRARGRLLREQGSGVRISPLRPTLSPQMRTPADGLADGLSRLFAGVVGWL